MQSINKIYFYTILITSFVLTLIFKKNINIIYFTIIFLFIPSIIIYFIHQMKFKDTFSKYKSINNIELGIQSFKKNDNIEIESSRKKMISKMKMAYISFIYIVFLLLFMAFLS